MTTSPSSSFLRQPPVLGMTIAFAYIYFAWGATYLALHFSLESLPPFLVAGSRFLIAGAFLLALLRVLQRREFHWGDSREWKDAAIVSGLLLVGGNGVLACAQVVVPTGVSALLFGSMPLWIIVFDWIRPGGGRPSPRTCVGLVLGLIGVGVLVDPGALEGGSSRVLWGEVALLFAACSWAAGGIYSRHVHARGSPLLPMARQMIAGGSMLLLLSAAHRDWHHFAFARVSLASWLGFLYLLIFGSLIGFPIYVWLMRVSTPARVATISYVNLLVAVLLGWLILREPMTLHLLIGAAVTVGSVVLVLKKPKSLDEVIDE
jgi:drug/metabolite transporter (DMT)-like permease